MGSRWYQLSGAVAMKLKHINQEDAGGPRRLDSGFSPNSSSCARAETITTDSTTGAGGCHVHIDVPSCFGLRMTVGIQKRLFAVYRYMYQAAPHNLKLNTRKPLLCFFINTHARPHNQAWLGSLPRTRLTQSNPLLPTTATG